MFNHLTILRKHAHRALLIALLPGLLSACSSDESKGKKAAAGTYAMRSTADDIDRWMEGSTLTLSPDGTYEQRTRMDMGGETTWARENGTWQYRTEGPTIAMRSDEGQPINLLVQGDTLMPQANDRAVAFAEAVTNVKVMESSDVTYYLRQR